MNISIYIREDDTDLLDRLERIGFVLGRTRSWLVGDAIEQYVRLKERELCLVGTGIRSGKGDV